MGHTYARTVRNHYANHDQPTPHTNTHARARALVACGIGKVGHKVCGGHSTGETPSNIPNLEAKPGNANGTAIDRSWESRTPPQHNHTKTTRPPPPSQPGDQGGGHPHTHTHPHHTRTHPQGAHNTTPAGAHPGHARTRTRAVTQGTPSTTTPTPTPHAHTPRAHAPARTTRARARGVVDPPLR